ncbi:MAG: DASH family cryptochrome, partial [Leptolyngbya sp. SIO1D8]|nr:DASH family cryptochrome [Leptolyngbya sp. SIO1D8]
RNTLRRLGSDLIIRQGKPEVILPTLATQTQAQAVYLHKAATTEEIAVETAVTNQIETLGLAAQTYWGATLYHPEKLPFSLGELPDVFTKFRKQVERECTIHDVFPSPKQLPSLPTGIEAGELPTLADWGLADPTPDDRAVLAFQGGETAGLTRLQHYIWDADCLKAYKQTRNGMLGADYSSKFSPWLALGCLSPRQIYEAIQAYEEERVKNDSTYWLIFELLWRDYFWFVCAKAGDRIFYPSGLRGLKIAWKQDWPRFDAWRNGKTGYPLVDANMQELAATGFMSNRGRQNVASFLTKNLGIDWRMGAEWFESLLVDYDVCSNWGNWNYTAGVGNDARGFRYFNILKQSKDYDPQGNYVKHWLPALRHLPADKVHSPWALQPVEQKRFNLRLGVDYPKPIVDLQKSGKANEKIYQAALEQLG